jgi:general secretion pathway protein D
VLQVKGFTTVPGPGGAIKIIPIRDAKEQSIETGPGRAAVPDSDRFITRLIPLRYIDAEAIANTLKPLVSKDAALVAYPPTNTVILTDSASNISRILSILESIDVETYREQLAVIKIRHADAATLAQQLSEIYGGEVTGAEAGGPQVRARTARRTPQAGQITETAAREPVRFITDERTNSLIVLASRQKLGDIRATVQKLDVPVSGGGRIHVYYLKNADAEELAQTLSSLISGQPAPSAGGAQPGGQAAQALRAAVTELAEGVTVTADAATNSLVIQASQEGFSTLSAVIALLDIPRPQVLVEALIMEVDVTNAEDLGFNGIVRVFQGEHTSYGFGSLTDAPARPTLFGSGSGTGGTGGSGASTIQAPGTVTDSILDNLIATAARNTLRPVLLPSGNPVLDAFGRPVVEGTLIQGIIRASASDNRTNVVSAPHILTSDNEEAEIKVGANIPIITSRVQSAAGIETAAGTGNLATSVNVERQDIGVTLRVTPQISEGEQVRLDIFQEITAINSGLAVGDPEDVGVALSSRKVENTVVVQDSETVVIGGLISDDYQDTINKVPWLGDIPILGWAFKSTTRNLAKTNLLVFLTPHVVRTAADLEQRTVHKREEFRERSSEAVELSEKEKKEEAERRERAEAAGITFEPSQGRFPVRALIKDHETRYPVERMREIEQMEDEGRARRRAEEEAAIHGPRYRVLAAVFRSEAAAASTLQEVLDAGYDATLVSGARDDGVLFELRLGPYASLEEAEHAADTVREAFGLSPSVTVEEAE